MNITTSLRITDAFGRFLVSVPNYISLDYTLNSSPGGVGMLELTLPASFPLLYLFKDGRIIPMRSVNGSSPAMDNGAVFLIKHVKVYATKTVIRAYHANLLASYRIIAYPAGSTYTSKAATPADDLIKTLWKENAGTSIVGADRDGDDTQADISAYVSVQANLSQGASIAESCTREILANTMRRLCEASTTAGTYLTFEIFGPTESTLELRTYAVQRGVNRGLTTSAPFVLSESRGNLENVVLTTDYTSEKTFIIAGGQGQGVDRMILTSYDTPRMGTSPFGRIEDFLDYSNTYSSTVLQDQADSALWYARPTNLIAGDLIPTPTAIRGIHYDLGDIVSVEHPRTGIQFNARLDVIHEHFEAGQPGITAQSVAGTQTTIARLRSVS